MVFVTPVVEHCLEREITMKDRSGDPSQHERTLNHGVKSRSTNILSKLNTSNVLAVGPMALAHVIHTCV